MVKHDKPLKFIVMFYKADDKWEMFKFKYDDELGDELEEAGKVYLIK